MGQVHRERLEIEPVIADRYAVVRRIAKGGMGSVYLGRQLGLDRHVAIKVLLPEQSRDPDVAGLFRSEAKAIKHLTHPNTVRLYDFGETASGLLYLVMEYLEGECLDTVLQRRGRLPKRMVQRIAEQVLKSLIEAHARGIVHRDIKPSNLMLCRQLGEPELVKLLDFGIALQRRHQQPGDGDRPAEVMGTPRYMSPEQLRGDRLDPRSDLYSLGLTLYELATGAPAFPQSRLDKVLAARLADAPLELPVSLRNTRLGEIIIRATAPQVGDRFPAAGDMLEAFLATPTLRDTGPVPVIPSASVEDPLQVALDPTLPRFPGEPVERAPHPHPTSSGGETRSVPTLPYLQAVLGAERGDKTPTEDRPRAPRPATEPPPETVDPESLPADHPLVELLRDRFERRLRRRTLITAAVTLSLTLGPILLSWLLRQ